jgi:uncharacterized protein YdiU (UPF0061 family)
MTPQTNAASPIHWDHSYARLPGRFFAPVTPTPVRAPALIRVNGSLAAQLGLDADALSAPDGVEALAGNVVPQNSEPIAMAYAGHQFGHFVPQLGDGRAILLGEVIDRENKRFDIQLKGAGRTPFSRGGDGRAALGPVLREYILSEAMTALGIPSTRALAAVTTGEMVRRTIPAPGAILTRVASSHIRVGTFQYFAARRDSEAIRLLADHVIARHYPHCADATNPYRALLDAVVRGQAELIAQWMLVGFIHGVMNTDNTSIACETIDYGPCAFMDAYNPAMVYSSIDDGGRYAFSNQPRVAQWNLARLAETMLDLLAEEQVAAIRAAEAAIEAFPSHFEAAYTAGLRRKLGLFEARPGDLKLAQDLLDCMAKRNADFTLTFRGLCEPQLLPNSPELDAWLEKWRARLSEEGADPITRREQMRAANPLFIPRNHLVEEAIVAAVDKRDFQPFETLLAVVSKPYDDQPDFPSHTLPPRPDQIVHQTFCGT